MKAALFQKFEEAIEVTTVPDPTPSPNGVVIRVEATGICRSDWHGWKGHDSDVTLPHVPGHEFAGVVEETGKNVLKWSRGDRVTAPFICACGSCEFCENGNQQVCPNQQQPGFTHWGSFASLVSIPHAEENLVRLPDELDFISSASLGCRLATSYRAVVHQARARPGHWLAIHGCGGVGLSALMVANALGVQTIAIDVDPEILRLATKLGATNTINANATSEIVGTVVDITSGGAHYSIDSLGSTETATNSIRCLRPRGRHIQVGLMVEQDATSPVPFDQILAHELEIIGSHGMQSHCYPELFNLITSKGIDPGLLISGTCDLSEGAALLTSGQAFGKPGITVITGLA
ncbi:MAG TPA: alcohol dehydrogenase [Verrucomicrobiales bacterium]|nr:alcohol dehydrogenase [Verrucomicrobiales bacterium]HCQ39747.1 alcohol dehydrogenase [Verrucomicrobiales bacterium]|tara:strand:+ start:556 stop:1599 length:1044 start_codon:yes stop_codon:yes gene_type:complete